MYEFRRECRQIKRKIVSVVFYYNNTGRMLEQRATPVKMAWKRQIFAVHSYRLKNIVLWEQKVPRVTSRCVNIVHLHP